MPGRHDTARRGTRASRDAEVREVTAELDALLEHLAANVAALSAILTRPDRPQGPDDERLLAP